jgi:hypothetical protein
MCREMLHIIYVISTTRTANFIHVVRENLKHVDQCYFSFARINSIKTIKCNEIFKKIEKKSQD